MPSDRREILIPKLVVPDMVSPDGLSKGIVLPERMVEFGWRTKLWSPPKVIPPCEVCQNTEMYHICVPDAIGALAFFLNLRLTDGDFRGHQLKPINWIAKTVPWIFGMKMFDKAARVPGHYRLIQELVLSITRGGMKSTFLEALICYYLWSFPDGSEGMFAQQSKKETLAKMVPKVLDMISLSPIMNPDKFHWVGKTERPGGGDKFYRGERNKGRGEVSMRVLSYRLPRELKGYRGNFAVFDEYGMVPTDQAEISIEETFKKSVIVPEWLCVVASTLARESAHYQRRETTRATEAQKRPEIAPRLWSVLFCSDATEDIYSPTTWYKTMPLLQEGIVSEASVAEEAAAAKLDPTKEDTFAIERCGQAGEISARLVRREEWIACAAEGGLQEILTRMKGGGIFVGFDFSETSDLASMGLVKEVSDELVLMCGFHFIPDSAVASLDAKTNGKITSWRTDGWLEVLPAGFEMPRLMAERCLELLKPIEKDIVALGYDVAHSSEAAAVLREYGKKHRLWDDDRAVLGIVQGGGLTQPIKAIKIGSRYKHILHPGDPVLDYCVLNSYIEPSVTDPDKLRLVKVERNTQSERIDSAVAVLTAWQRLIGWKAEQSQLKQTWAAEPFVTRKKKQQRIKDGLNWQTGEPLEPGEEQPE